MSQLILAYLPSFINYQCIYFHQSYILSISIVWIRQLHFEKRERSNYQGDKDVHSSPYRMLASSHGGGSESMHDTMVGRQRLDLPLDVSGLSIMIIDIRFTLNVLAFENINCLMENLRLLKCSLILYE